MLPYRLTRWPTYDTDIREEKLRVFMHNEGLRPYAWSNGPNFEYSAHTHSYTKVLYVVRGSIIFHLPETQDDIVMRPGDRLDLFARVLHAASVGAEGVTCLEAVRRDS